MDIGVFGSSSRGNAEIIACVPGAIAIPDPQEPGRLVWLSFELGLCLLCRQVDDGLPGNKMGSRVRYWIHPG